MARIKGSSEVLEARRRRAMALLDEGRSLNEVGRLLGCSASSVMRWQEARASGGDAALKVRQSPGRPPKLDARARRRLVSLLLRGAMANGYATDLWTTSRIAEVIEANFRVAYHPDHVGRLMEQLGWSHQKPEQRAVERDEERIQRWRRTTWSRVKKTPQGWAPTSFSSTNRASS
jgi:transposase